MAAVMAGVRGTRDEAEARANGLLAAMSGQATGAYSNFVGEEGQARVHDAYPRATYERLVAVKRRVDPANVFNANQNIQP
jgi:hypothetical protein